MPIYEYRRPDGTTFEVMQSFSDPPLSVDPDSGAPVQRVLHAPALHFKGNGFYSTDYGSRNRQRETAAAAQGSGGEGSSGDSSSDGAASTDGSAAAGKGATKSENGSKKAPKPPDSKQTTSKR